MKQAFAGKEEKKSKLEVAKDSLLLLLSRLTEKDRFGLVLFDTSAYVVQPLELLSKIDVNKLKKEIMELETKGGTTLTAGINAGTKQFEEVLKTKEATNSENRIIFLTDMIPNSAATDGETLFRVAKQNVTQKLYTTFIGVGIDFNTDLVSLISKIRASNYISVKSSKDFKKQLDEEFDYLVTPNVFNGAIDMDSEGWKPIRVFGSPGFEIPEKGRLMFMDSSFPSAKEGGNMTKGGVVVVKLEKQPGASSTLKFKTSYEDRTGKIFTENDEFKFPLDKDESQEDYFENASTRKAVLLVRYVNFIKQFLRDVADDKKVPSISTQTGIAVPEVIQRNASKSSSHRSVAKELDEAWKTLFKKFIDHFEKEMEAIQDNSLDRELQHILTISQKV
jgi:Ca-activated chloride channel family protein